MDTSALCISCTVLRERSIRAAARALKKPVATVGLAINRLQTEMSVVLLRKAGADLVLTLEGERLLPTIFELEKEIFALSPGFEGNIYDTPIKFDALSRFLKVTEIGSIRRAAHSIGLGQPQLTRQISQFEGLFATPLLTRSVDGSVPTIEGTRVAACAATIGRLWRELADTASGRFREREATVRLGSIIPLGHDSPVAALLASLLVRWQELRPRQPLFLSCTTAEELISGLKIRAFDATILDTLSVSSDLDHHLIATTPLALVGGPEDQPPDASPASLRNLLLTHSIAVPSSRSGLRQMFNRLLKEIFSEDERSKLKILEADSLPVLMNLVLEHGFMSLLPAPSVAAIRNSLIRAELSEELSLPLWLVWPKRQNSQKVAANLISVLQMNSR
ncbi:LysR family transcriptional regulator [Brucella pseudogrignonensis]|uniref:LysR family transcriptional regulator n=1 Tax=Brucella pseudogrignonensis TaxID=419475 RepID=UPI003ECDC86C